ncbi:MAG: CBS domain-containing protein [Sphingomonadaceae bacterium]|uniref:CBS domain-containing protein n=1 Tax=Thermaurantiacus sp. TaxID=2820283 RepID=UPI00298F3949|nr:CBS domain-containing protein [Thermaurantiacus sp.]MCS6986193.1 CBS domain-containing protein [Sphingomonadaceae bacterium]MDW8415849.1 CBS domain-containing protein [Thermaurantiacus sp.]
MGIAAILRDKGHAVVTIAAHHSVRDVVSELVVRRIGALPVTEGESLVGLVSERDVIRALAAEGAAALDRPVREVMTTPIVTIGLHDSVTTAMALMTDRRIRHLPVVEGGRLVGIVSIGDLVKRRIEEVEQEALALRDYIAQA